MNRKFIASIMSVFVGMSVGISNKVNAEINNGWVNNNTGWSYYENGSVKTGWVNDKGNFYYLKDDGNMAVGWINVNNKWYYMSESGAMKTGWVQYKGAWYYLSQNGEMVSNDTVDGYYLGVDGSWVEKNSTNDVTEINDESKNNITMETEKTEYGLNTKEITVYITNNGKQSAYYGVEYAVEKFVDNKWSKVPFKDEPMFIEIAYNLEPGKTSSQVISLENFENLTAGKYRIVKFSGKCAAEFELK